MMEIFLLLNQPLKLSQVLNGFFLGKTLTSRLRNCL